MKKLLQKSIVAVLVLGLLLLLRFYFENSYLSIAVIVVFGLMCAIASRIFVGVVIPNQILFRSRFIIYGIGFGLMIGLTMSFIKVFKEQVFLTQELIKWIFIAVPVGIMIHSSTIYLKFRKLKKRTIGNSKKSIVISDFALFINSEYKTERGLVALSDNKLSFYENTYYKCLYETILSEVNPKIIKSKYLSIPNEFSVQNDTYSIIVAFPLYWKKLIEDENKSEQL